MTALLLSDTMRPDLILSVPDQSELRRQVFDMEYFIKQQKQADLKVVNYFSHGVYARELHIPPETLLTGDIHKYKNLNILSQGEMSVLTEDGVKRVKAPFTIVSPPGTKRIAYTHSYCIWTTIHGTFERNIDKIKEYFIATTEQEYLEFCGQMVLELKRA